MNNSRPVAETYEHGLPDHAPLPRPKQTGSKWPGRLVWVVPLLAACVAAFYFWRIYQRQGVEISITFQDALQLRVRDTPLVYHGVRVGSISSVDLDADRTSALVHVRLERAFEDTIARDGGKFWLVRPDLDGGMLSGLGTVITGPYIDCAPGTGGPAYQFHGLDAKPVILGDGLRVVLHTPRLEHLGVQSPVYYRGMQVGAVQDIRFSSDSTEVNVTLFIYDRYRKLLRPGSRFWVVSGADVQGGLFSGIKVQVNNLRALVAGGVAFATPDDGDTRAVPDGSYYTLHAEADKEWTKWATPIPLPNDESPNGTPNKPDKP